MRRWRIRCSFFVCGLVLNVGAWAQTRVPEVVVPAPKTTTPSKPSAPPLPSSPSQRDPSGAQTQRSMETFRGEAKDTPEVLATTPGVVVQSRGGVGQLKSVSIRGASSSGVMVLLDGIPLTQGGTQFDLSMLPPSMVETVEVVRGAAGARYGSGGLGGVIHVRTKAPSVTPKGYAQLSLGSFSTFQSHAGLSAKLWDGELAAGVYGLRSQGDFEFAYDDLPNWPANSLQPKTRLNNDASQIEAWAKYGRQVGASRFEVLAEGYVDERGLAGTVQNPTLDARQSGRRMLLGGRWERTFERGEMSAMLFGRSSGLLLTGGLLGAPGWQWDVASGAEWNGQMRLGAAHRLSGHVQAFYESVTGPPMNLEGAQRDLVSQAAWLRSGAMVGDEWWLNGNWALLPSVRVDSAGQFVALSPKLGLLWLGPKSWEVKANVGQASRLPSFMELYVRAGQLLPNPSLQPERAWYVDGEISKSGKTWRMSSAAFFSDYEQLITYEFYPPLLARPYNFARAQVWGLENEATYSPGPMLKMSLNYTWLQAINRQEDARVYGKAIPFRPNHTVHARVDGGPKVLKAHAEVFFQSEQFQNRTQTLSLPARAMVNVGVSSSWDDDLPFRVSLELKNLLDVRAADVDGYPLPSRGVFLTLSTEHDFGHRQRTRP